MSKMCCFFGHGNYRYGTDLTKKIYDVMKVLVEQEDIKVFVAGSKSDFVNMCCTAARQIEKEYNGVIMYFPEKKPFLSSYTEQIMEQYEATYFPEKDTDVWEIINVKYNKILLNQSDFCLIYYDKDFKPADGKNEVLPSYQYARRKNVFVINFGDETADSYLEFTKPKPKIKAPKRKA